MDRSQRIKAWLKPWLTTPNGSLITVAGDASFRSYYRISASQSTTGNSLILMDAPPDKESSQSFIQLAKTWHAQGIKVPAVIAYDLVLGIALLEDFGDVQLMQRIQAKSTTVAETDTIYRQALQQLMGIQALPTHHLPKYSVELLTRELALFDDWLLKDLLKFTPKKLPANWSAFQQQLIATALAQPQVTVHRDYHSRNLMVLANNSLGIIDFQDAVVGPCTYDAVSLIRDCYLNWPTDKQQAWLAYFHQLYCQQAEAVSLAEFTRWFDWMGMQRHLKAAGIFARLWLRDGKASFLQDVPLTLQHLLRATQHYPELADIQTWLADVVIPAFTAFLQQHSKPSKQTVQHD
ncbi:MAG TPA: phosphotransferase [Marinospirillum sp.]|uniref:aminoglycoside phosphotransferase family protein n=1 Tax=Marinospirillum sp. TaxID=2183934 RepID=UPI002B471743|nr:phosphotransferase [Marinospirillum sp.]HKM14951.1 phosphotransferase [Marinospirillum sp.]